MDVVEVDAMVVPVDDGLEGPPPQLMMNTVLSAIAVTTLPLWYVISLQRNRRIRLPRFVSRPAVWYLLRRDCPAMRRNFCEDEFEASIV